MPNKQRDKGHRYERSVRLDLQDFFPDCETSRYASRKMDDLKVDLVDTGMFNVQCKCVARLGAPHKLLDQMPKDVNYNVIFHKLAGKRTGVKEVVTMEKEDFLQILQMLQNNDVI